MYFGVQIPSPALKNISLEHLGFLCESSIVLLKRSRGSNPFLLDFFLIFPGETCQETKKRFEPVNNGTLEEDFK